MTPNANINKTDGNLGVANDTDRILVIFGTAAAGAFDSPQAFTDKNDIIEEHESGPLVHAAVYMIARGIPVVLVRGNPSTDGAYGAIDDTGITGTATVAAGATKPDDDYRCRVEIVNGGALGTAGITYRFTMDDGSSWSDPQALGVSLTLTCDGGVSFTLSAAADTLVAGDTWSVDTTAPALDSSDLQASYDALTDYDGEWLRVLVLADADETLLAQANTFATSLHIEGKNPEVIMNSRARDYATESRADFQAALAAIAVQVQSTEVSPCADRCEIVSSVDGRRLVRHTAIPFAARTMIIDDSQDAAAKADGALPDVFVTTRTGERRYHDEMRFPGLDAIGYTTLRTWRGRPRTPGVYINNPRLLSGPGSDYRYFQHSAIENRIIESAYQIVSPKLSMSVLVDPETGRIREDVATSIDEAVTAELRTLYSDPGRVSGVKFRLSRTDNVLSTDTLSFNVWAVPLGYVKQLQGKSGLVRVLPNS